MAVSQVSFSKTPQAKDDFFANSVTEDSLSTVLDVLGNDLGGNAKSLYSLGNGSNGRDLLLRDTARSSATSADVSAQGARIWITADGKIGYDATSIGLKFQSLAVGQYLDDTFSYAVQLGNGTISTATVTVRIVGVNDKPQITSATQSGAAKEDDSLSATGKVAATDVDNGDHQHYAVSGNAAGAFGSFSVDAATGQWTYQLANGAGNVQALAQGENHTEIFVVRVKDDQGAYAEQSVSIQIAGSNDGPKITSSEQAAVVTEDERLGAAGQVRASDVDNGDHQHYAIQGSATGSYGAIAVDAYSGNWSYALSNGAANVQALGQGEKHADTFTVRVTDHFGATADQAVTVTVSGTNDRPVITSALQFGAVTEELLLATGGLVAASDVDNGDHQHYSIDPSQAGTYGSISVNAASGQWNYALANGAANVQALAQGERQADTFAVRVTDDFGASASQTVTIAVLGTNDGPVITSAPQFGAVMEEWLPAVIGQVTASDVDNGDHQHFSIFGGAVGAYGAFAVDAGRGAWSYLLANETPVVQALAFGETKTDQFTVRVTDDFGATADQVVAVSIFGTNDRPLVAAALTSVTTEDNDAYTIDLLSLAFDVDHGSVLHASAVTEVSGKGGWSLVGDVIIITPGTFGDVLNTGDFENLVFSYQVLDEHGASAAQSLSVTIQGITDAPSLDVVTSAGARVNELLLTISSEPANHERVGLTFSEVPAGARLYDTAGHDVTGGISNYHGTSVFKLVLVADRDALEGFTVTATGYNPDDSPYKATVRPVDLGYDVAAEGKALAFSSDYINMWGEFDGLIEFHEYLPIVGGAPIFYDATAKEWKAQESDYWHAGEASIVDVRLDSQKVFDTVSEASTAVLDAAKHIFDVTAGAIDAQVQKDFNTAQGILNQARYDFFNGARVIDEGIRKAFDDAKAFYLDLKADYDQASQDFYTWIDAPHDSEAARWQGSEEWWWGMDNAGRAANLIPRGLDWIRWEAADLAYKAAKLIWDGVAYAFEWTATNTYNGVKKIYDEAVDAANKFANKLWDGAQATFDGAKKLYDDAKKVVFDAALGIYNTAKNGVLDTLKAVTDKVDYASQFTVKADVFAKAGLQVDVVLDLGSANTQLNYDLTSKTQYNKASDVLVITPTMLNKTTGETVAFDTISPNAKFYIALLYDAGAKFDVLMDGHLKIAGHTWYDLTPGNNQPLQMSEDVSPIAVIAEIRDLLTDLGLPTDDLDAMDPGGKLVLVDFDSTRGTPPLGGFELPLVGTLTQDIVKITVAWPNVATEGTMQGSNKPPLTTREQIAGFYDEGGLVAVDFSEITDSLFNLITARLDYSPELIAKVPGLQSLQQAGNFNELVESALKAFTAVLLDVLDGQSEETPIFLLDATDQTDSSVVHVQLLPDDLSTLNANTGSFGFYSSYGETNPIANINIDIDQLIAVIVNEIVETALEAASQGAAITILEALPSINPADITIGLDTLLKVLQLGHAEREAIGKFLDLNINVQAVDVDVYADAKISQKFALSVDDMSYLVTLEDGESYTFTAKGAGSLTIENASSHDANHDGSVAYTMDIVPTAMFSNDTELKLGVGYVLDFLKGSVAAGIKLPLDELLGINADWLKISIPLVDVAVGPLLRVQGDLDVIDIDLFESRFNVNAGSDSFDGSVYVQLAGVDQTLVPA